LARIQLLILDDWAMAKLTAEQRRDLMEVIDERHQRASTILATQVPIGRWHDMIGTHLCRRHPRSAHPQRLPHRSEGRLDAAAPPGLPRG
jgi:DNA replication protein DnaC